MKAMLIAAALTGGLVATLIMFGKRNLPNIDAKSMRDRARKYLSPTDGQPKRNPLQSMG